MRRAEKYLYKRSPKYREYVQAQETKEKEEEYKRQGEMLATAISSKLGAAIQAQAWATQIAAAAAPQLPAPQQQLVMPPAAFTPVPGVQAAVQQPPGQVAVEAPQPAAPQPAIDVSEASRLSPAQRVVIRSLFKTTASSSRAPTLRCTPFS